MTAPILSGDDNEKGKAKPESFSIINANDISYVRRGRKPIVNTELIAALKTLPKGKAIVCSMMQLDPKSNKYATDKARISSQIRTACKLANLATFSIIWSDNGVPNIRH
jgi:hypothetical protein